MMTTTNTRGIKSVRTAFEIVEVLEQQGGAGPATLADELDLAKSTVHDYLATLYDLEYLTKDNGEYDVGFRFLEHGGYAKNRREAYILTENTVEELADLTDERVQFVVEEFGQAVYLHRETGDDAMRLETRIGKRYPLHVISAGKAIFAHLPDARVSEIIEHRGLPSQGPNTITNPARLREELETVRDRGFATNDEENLPGVRAVGVPILDASDTVLGSVSVSGPVSRLKGDYFGSELPELVMDKVNELELSISHSVANRI